MTRYLERREAGLAGRPGLDQIMALPERIKKRATSGPRAWLFHPPPPCWALPPCSPPVGRLRPSSPLPGAGIPCFIGIWQPPALCHSASGTCCRVPSTAAQCQVDGSHATPRPPQYCCDPSFPTPSMCSTNCRAHSDERCYTHPPLHV